MKLFWGVGLLLVTGGSSAAGGPVLACQDLADVVGKYAQRCGLNYKANRDAFEKGLPGGSCSKTKSVRDEVSLRSTCFSFWNTLSCSEANNPNLA